MARSPHSDCPGVAVEPLPAAHWHVYIVASVSGALYTGITTDLERRMSEHRIGRRGARFFRVSPAARLLYCESHPTRSSALRREAAIKNLPRAAKLVLIRAAGSVATALA